MLAIDGQDIKAGDNYWKILSTTPNEYIPVKVAKTPAGEGARVVRIASVTSLGNIKYEEWVLNNRDIVEKATNGQIAYVHIRSMDQASLERFQNEIDRFWNKKGIIIDVRYNTGGNIDEQLLDIIERRPYMFTNSRTGARTWGRRPQQAIAGPKVMMINQRSFSDGEATPMGFRTLGLGRIVGTPTAGGVIWTGSYSLINGGSVRTPGQLAVTYDPTKPNNYGINLENYGVPPDVWVQNTPMDEVKGSTANSRRRSTRSCACSRRRQGRRSRRVASSVGAAPCGRPRRVVSRGKGQAARLPFDRPWRAGLKSCSTRRLLTPLRSAAALFMGGHGGPPLLTTHRSSLVVGLGPAGAAPASR